MAINLEQINELKKVEEATGQSGLINKICNLLIESLENENPLLIYKLSSEEFESASKLAHSLKSSCRNLGLDSLGDIYQNVENLGKDHSGADIGALTTEINRNVSEAIKDVKQLLSQL